MDSLEYALTDVDKIVVCAAAPRPDEEGFKDKFRAFLKDNIFWDGNEAVLREIESSQQQNKREPKMNDDTDMEWERLESVMEVRAKLAEQIDLIGVQNLVRSDVGVVRPSIAPFLDTFHAVLYALIILC